MCRLATNSRYCLMSPATMPRASAFTNYRGFTAVAATLPHSLRWILRSLWTKKSATTRRILPGNLKFHYPSGQNYSAKHWRLRAGRVVATGNGAHRRSKSARPWFKRNTAMAMASHAPTAPAVAAKPWHRSAGVWPPNERETFHTSYSSLKALPRQSIAISQPRSSRSRT